MDVWRCVHECVLCSVAGWSDRWVGWVGKWIGGGVRSVHVCVCARACNFLMVLYEYDTLYISFLTILNVRVFVRVSVCVYVRVCVRGCESVRTCVGVCVCVYVCV